MSRIGNKLIIAPAGVEIILKGNELRVKGKLGELKQDFNADLISVEVKDDQIKVIRKNDTKLARAHHGLYRSLFYNLIEGVENGFSKTLEIRGVGYRVALKERSLELNLGFSHLVYFDLPDGVDIAFQEKNQNIFTISGINKQLVGQVVANIRGLKKPEPYKGKGIRYIDEKVVLKAGKSAKK